MNPAALLDGAARALRQRPPAGVTAREIDSFLTRKRPSLMLALGPLLPNHDRVVTLNLGLGRDSLAMLCLLAQGRLRADGRRLDPAEVDAVVFSDPGAEWPGTYGLLPRVRRFCMANNLRFLALRKPNEALARAYLDALPPPNSPGRREALDLRPWRKDEPPSIEEKAAIGWYHLRPAILDDYESRATIASRGKKDCTINHKVEPIRKLIADLSVERFGLDNAAWGAEVRAGRRRPHLSLIGIAADEAERAIEAHPLHGGRGPWYVTEAYPLIEMGLNKADEAEILEACGFDDAHKSGCVMCPFQPVSWYWALRETDPAQWARVVGYKARALERNPRMFLVGDAPIAEMVAAWRSRNPAATVGEVMAKSYRRCSAVREAA